MTAKWRVTEVCVLDDNSIQVRFIDGLESVVHFSPDFFKGVFLHLKDTAKFREVAVVDGAVTWPGGLDLAPDAMYQDIKRHGNRLVEPFSKIKNAARKPGGWPDLPEAKADWDSPRTNAKIARTLIEGET